MIKAKIISKQKAIEMGLRNCIGSGSNRFALEASGKIGDNIANTIKIIDTKTDRECLILEKNKKINKKIWKKKIK